MWRGNYDRSKSANLSMGPSTSHDFRQRASFGVAALCFFPVALIQWWDLLGKSLEATPDGATLFVNLYFFGAGPESIAFAVSAIAAVVVLRAHVLNITDQELFGLPDRSPSESGARFPALVAHAVPKYAAIALGFVLVIFRP